MGDARSDDDRLPWLDASRPAQPTPAARRARTPLLVVLGLFLASVIAVMAFLTGRGTALAPAPSATAPSPAPTAPVLVPPPALVPIPTPLPAAPVAPPAPAAAPLIVAPTRAGPATSRAARPTARRKASVRRAAPWRPARAVVAQDPTERAPATPRGYAVPQPRAIWPARPFAGPRGRVIQIGAYTTQPQADAAWWRLARVYPYLATLPRMVSVIGPSRGRPLYYRVRLAAGSNREARALCDNLHGVGRGCMIV